MSIGKRKNDPSIPRISAERLRELLAYDPATGIFTNLTNRSARARSGAVVGSPDADGYLLACIDWRAYKLHQLAFLYMTGKWPEGLVDHRDTCRSNNRWANLRVASHAINSQNIIAARRRNGTGLLGASYDKTRGKFLAQILVAGVKKNLGRFETAELAHQAYLEAKRKHHEGNTL